MLTIHIATFKDASTLAEIGSLALVESHGHSASDSDIRHYVENNMSEQAFQKELNDPENIYHIIYADGRGAGYSKIVFNSPNPNVPEQEVTKLGRIYILKEFYGQQIGKELFDFILNLSKDHDQKGMWLNVWTENERAVRFYKRQGFEIVGKHDFEVSPTHTNPNHVMYLSY